jgi:hypothetical protein
MPHSPRNRQMGQNVCKEYFSFATIKRILGDFQQTQCKTRLKNDRMVTEYTRRVLRHALNPRCIYYSLVGTDARNSHNIIVVNVV